MTNDQDDWQPAFPGQRRPFQRGHELRLVHGARSERRIAPRAQEELDRLLADPDLPAYLHDPSYRGALTGLARCQAVISLIEDFLIRQSMDAATAGALPVLEQYRKWLTTAASHRRALGLDPMSRATLTKDLSMARSAAADAVRTQATAGAAVLAARRADIEPATEPASNEQDGELYG